MNTNGADHESDTHPQQSLHGARAIGAAKITARGPVLEMTFPPLRATGSALVLAAFGAACVVIGAAAVLGLSSSGSSTAGSMLALAFAGVFALPLAGLGISFFVVAMWTAANSLNTEISSAGVQTQRSCFSVPVSRRWIARDDLIAVDARLAARFVGVFGSDRYYCLYARSRDNVTLIADSLKGPDIASEVRDMVIRQLGMPALESTSNDLPMTPGNN